MEQSSSIELSSVIQNELSAFHDVSLEGVDVLMQTICDGFTKIPSSIQSDVAIRELEGNKCLEKLSPQRISQLYTSLATLVLTAASQNVLPSKLEAMLNTYKWSPEQIARFLKYFSPNQSKIQAILKLYGTPTPPKIVDVNWRLDYQLETNTRGPINELLYIIELILEDNGRREPLSFTASHAELEDLVNTLKDACQSVKRVALL